MPFHELSAILLAEDLIRIRSNESRMFVNVLKALGFRLLKKKVM